MIRRWIPLVVVLSFIVLTFIGAEPAAQTGIERTRRVEPVDWTRFETQRQADNVFEAWQRRFEQQKLIDPGFNEIDELPRLIAEGKDDEVQKYYQCYLPTDAEQEARGRSD